MNCPNCGADFSARDGWKPLESPNADTEKRLGRRKSTAFMAVAGVLYTLLIYSMERTHTVPEHTALSVVILTLPPILASAVAVVLDSRISLVPSFVFALTAALAWTPALAGVYLLFAPAVLGALFLCGLLGLVPGILAASLRKRRRHDL